MDQSLSVDVSPQCPSVWDFLLRSLLGSVGAIFLASIAFKVIDPLFLDKVRLASLYGVSLAIDLLVGTMLFAVPTWLIARLLALLVSIAYLGYHYSNAYESCDCFGSTEISTFATASFLILSVAILASSLVVRFTDTTTYPTSWIECTRRMTPV
jgi:hypothetical protein